MKNAWESEDDFFKVSALIAQMNAPSPALARGISFLVQDREPVCKHFKGGLSRKCIKRAQEERTYLRFESP